MDKKVVLITGTSSGIREESAKKLISEGHAVYGAARRVERMADLKASGMSVLKVDMIDEKSLDDVVKTVLAGQGRIDVLFNNAGYGITPPNMPLKDGRIACALS